MLIPAELWRGFDRSTAVPCTVEVLTPDVGRVACPECEGTGWWAYAEPEVPGAPCVDCKGQRFVFVSV